MSVLSFKSGNIKKNLIDMTKDNPNPSHVISVWIAISTPKNIIAKCNAK